MFGRSWGIFVVPEACIKVVARLIYRRAAGIYGQVDLKKRANAKKGAKQNGQGYGAIVQRTAQALYYGDAE
jgi:hypothetical protein